MSIPRNIRKKLPKAEWLRVEIGGYYDKPYYARFRGANFVRWQLWWVCVIHRAPWIEHVARQRYPHLFRED